jgi:hypothetical protein
MSSSTANTPEPPRQVQTQEVDEVLKTVWETAVRHNPMLLVNISDPHTAFEHLRRMIRDCLAKGLSAIETSEHAVKELLQSVARNRQPQETCHDNTPQNEQRAQS